MSTRIDRLVFAHAGADDFQPIASSMQPSQRGWTSWLRPHIRVGHERRPPVSLVYVRQSIMAAVLCRQAAGPAMDNRHDRCYCLIGPRHLLTARVALGLHGWVGWQPEYWMGPELVPCDIDGLTVDSEIEARRDGPGRRAELTAVVAAALRSPSKPLSIIADTESLGPRVALLWDVEAVLGELFEGCDRAPFTFSTFEEQGDLGASHLPEVIFNPPGPLPRSSYQARPQVQLRASALDQACDSADRVTVALVDRYLGEGRDSLVAFLRDRGVLASPSFDERIAALRKSNRRRGGPVRSPGDDGQLNEHGLAQVMCHGDAAAVRAAIERIQSDQRGPSNAIGLQKMLVRCRFFEARLVEVLPADEAQAAVAVLVRYAFAGTLAWDATVSRLLPLLASGDAPLAIAALRTLDQHNHLWPLTRQPSGLRWRLGTRLRFWALWATSRQSVAYGHGSLPAWVTWSGAVAIVAVLLAIAAFGGGTAPSAEFDAAQKIGSIGHYQAVGNTYQIMKNVDSTLEPTGKAGPMWYFASVNVAASVDFEQVAKGGQINIDENMRVVRLPHLVGRLGKAAVDPAISQVGELRDGAFQSTDRQLREADRRTLDETVAAEATSRATTTKLEARAAQNAEALLVALFASHGYQVVFT